MEKDYKPKIKFWHGVKSLGSNKYLWMVFLGTALMNVRVLTNIVPWINIYAIQEDYAMSLSVIILGTTLVPGMLLTGLFLKKFGKRNLMLASGFTTTMLYIPMIVFPVRPISLLVLMGCQILSNGFQTCVVIMPADALYHQQLKTGERLEGFYGNFSQLIAGIVLLIAGLIVPFILQASGMPESADVLVDENIRNAVFRNLNIFTMIVVFFATIPYLFWDLSEEKHKEITKQLEMIAKEKDRVKQSEF